MRIQQRDVSNWIWHTKSIGKMGLLMHTCVVLVLGVFVTHCTPNANIDAAEKELPVVEFDPSNSVVPLLNNLLLDKDTSQVALPRQCMESKAAETLRNTLNQLDGFGNFEPHFQASFSHVPESDNLEDHVLVYCRVQEGVLQDPASALPLDVEISVETKNRFDADCHGVQEVSSARIIPSDPLGENSTCVAAITNGLKTENGIAYAPSPTWFLVRQKEPPVITSGSKEDPLIVSNQTPLDASTLSGRKTLADLEELWEDHVLMLDFLEQATGLERKDFLVAWEITTQSFSLAFDQNQSGTPAALLSATADIFAIEEEFCGNQVETDFEDVWGSQLCDFVPCVALGCIVKGSFSSPSFQVLDENPGGFAEPVPGQWNFPLKPSVQEMPEDIPIVAFLPDSEAIPGPWPVLVLGHGLGGRKENWYAFAPYLAEAGFATIALDFVAHGDRAVQINKDEASGCDTIENFHEGSHCFAQFLTSDIGVTRDNIRQTVLDLMKLTRVLKQCGQDDCGISDLNTQKVGYLGRSLGGIIGGFAGAVNTDIEVAVLNVGAAGWVKIFTHSASPGIRCPLIDSLIAAGVLQGEMLASGSANALCLGDSWRDDPNFKEFASMAQWVLDAADPMNFGATLADRISQAQIKLLVQEVVGDGTVPNIASDQFAELLGLINQEEENKPYEARRALTMETPPPTTAINEEGNDSLWISYASLPHNADGPANTYSHGSLTSISTEESHALGTAQMRADVITFLKHAYGME